MGKFIDRQILNILISLCTFFILRLIKINTILCILLASIIFTILFISSIISKIKKNNKPSYRDFIIHSIINGEEKFKNYINIILKDREFEYKGNFFIYNNKAYFIILKFSNITYDNLLNIYKECKNIGINDAVIIAHSKDRKILNLLKYLDEFNIDLMTLYPIYKKLKAKNSLPIIKKNKILSYSINGILDSLLKKTNIKNFILAFIVTFILSYFTILKTYYLVFSIISLSLAIFSIIYNRNNKTKNLL